MRTVLFTTCVLMSCVFACPALAQTSMTKQPAARTAKPTISIARKLRMPIQNIRLENIPAEQAFKWWSGVTDIPLIIQWNVFEQYGLETTKPISLKLKAAPADTVLRLMMDLFGQEEELVIEVTEWYVQIMTRYQANKKTIRKVYHIGDLIMNIPNFDGAPSFDLTSALSNTSSGGGGANGGGGGGGGGGSIFSDNSDDDTETMTRTERGEEIANLIRETIEPDIWIGNGGQYSSIKYLNGMLIVNAPYYVHQQIGPSYNPTFKPVKQTDRFKSNTGGALDGFQPVGKYRSTGVSGINPANGKVSGISGKHK